MARHLSFLVIHSIWLLLILNAAAPAAESILPAKSGGPLQLHVGYVPILSQLPMVESYDSDQFSWQHVEIVLQSFQSTTALDAAFRVGAIDIAYLPLPNVVRMKADGVGISIWGRLHSGGSTLAIAGMERRPNHRPAVIGLPSIISNEHLLLLKYMENKGLQQGLDFKVLSIQFDKAPHHLRAGNIDGIFLPAPYPSMTRSELIGHDLVVEPVKQLLWERFSTVLAINNRLLAPR
jgi:ABC-type nitrate/sulfonate/bicarbonate transport system substrate-binding protein